jgi:aerobic carbon-monoxide dehydrogenase medium subunit
MSPPTIHHPTTLAEAVELLQRYEGEARVLAGSTALTLMIHQRLIDPPALVSLDRVPGLDSLATGPHGLTVGALVTHRRVERSDVVRAAAPVLTEAFGVVANVRVRNAATVGGVLAEADYASDPPTAFRALDATVHAMGPAGERAIPIADFFRGFYETALAPDEILVRVTVPAPLVGTSGAYRRYTTRSSEDRPCVAVAALVRLDGDGACEELRVAVGAATETPARFPELEAATSGRPVHEAAQLLADGYASRIDPLDDLRGSSWYRTEMIRVWVRRTVVAAAEAAAAPATA